jgi:tetratricopeptide (TPR) repeat protein
MKRIESWCLLTMLLVAAGASANADKRGIDEPDTTASVIAIANLDEQIVKMRDEPGVEDFLLLRSRFLADYDALDRAGALAENRFATGHDLLERARARAALHRFADALSDVEAAERQGVSSNQALPLRASILIATGHASDVCAQLKGELSRSPGFASRSMLASAYAAMGRTEEADRFYARALSELHTTLPFPYAWIYFARGLMWAEQGQKPERAEAMYRQALAYVPEFVGANINLAELEMVRGDKPAAMEGLSRVLRLTDEPEALALHGLLQARAGNLEEGEQEISRARQRFESLLARDPLAFADHAAEFYLGPGRDAERAWALAEQNLANRETDRSVALVVRAAEATGRYERACKLLFDHGPSLELYLTGLDRVLNQ